MNDIRWIVQKVLKVLFLSQIKAGFKTFQPKETMFAEDNPKFNKKVIFVNNYSTIFSTFS